MNFKTYLENLNKLAQENPETLEMTVIYSKDDEGNGYQEVHYQPTLGNYDPEDDWGGFSSEDNIKEEPEEYDEDIKINSICIN